jgi:hypothetical protein
MIQGVHAQTVTFVSLDRLTTLLEAGLWTSRRSQSNQAELTLTADLPRTFVVRLGSIRTTSKMTVCSLQLETPEEKFQPMVRATLEFTPVPTKSRTKIRLDGSAAARLVDGPEMTPTDEIRRMANDYARQLLSEIAARIEELAEKGEDRRPAKLELQKAGRNR